MNKTTSVLMNMLKRFLLTLSLLMLTQCTPTSGSRHVAVPPPEASVEMHEQVPPRPPEEQLEFFNHALDQA